MRRFLVLAILATLGYAGWQHQEVIRQVIDGAFAKRGYQRPTPQADRYETMVRSLAAERERLASSYRAAHGSRAKQRVLAEARELLELTLPEMMRCWIGTPWAFEGTATGPGDEPVACGYFVATIMRDAGFRVERIRLAQQPSSRIIKTFLPKPRTQLTVGQEWSSFVDELAAREPGIYIVGLDTHVGFIAHTGGEMRYLHSSGRSPKHVVDEGMDQKTSLSDSRWRMLGNVTADDDVLRSWLMRRPFPTLAS